MYSVLKPLALVALIMAAVPANAQVYKWVDSNGQTHFTQSPPPKEHRQQNAEVLQAKKSNHSTTVRDGISYCGDLRLPSDDDPLRLLINVKGQQSNWERQIEYKEGRLEDGRRQQLSQGRSSSSSYRSYEKYSQEIRDDISDLKCGLSWARAKETELQPVYDKFQSDYQATLDDFEQYNNRCGPKPDIDGWTTDPRAKEWVRCDRAGGTAEHNRKLREVKRMKSLASAFND